MVYPLTTKWRGVGGSAPHTLLLCHYDCWTVSYLAYWCLKGGGGWRLKLRPHTLLLRHYDCWTVSYLAYWCLGGGGGVSFAPICTLSSVNGAGWQSPAWLVGGGEGGVRIPHLLCWMSYQPIGAGEGCGCGATAPTPSLATKGALSPFLEEKIWIL